MIVDELASAAADNKEHLVKDIVYGVTESKCISADPAMRVQKYNIMTPEQQGDAVFNALKRILVLYNAKDDTRYKVVCIIKTLDTLKDLIRSQLVMLVMDTENNTLVEDVAFRVTERNYK